MSTEAKDDRGLRARAETWGSEDLVDRLDRCRLFLAAYGVLVPHEDKEVATRIEQLEMRLEHGE